MKSKLTKATAAVLAMSMCLPASVFAADAGTSTKGAFTTSFDVYSPELTINVPVNADVMINPLADSSATGVGYYSVATKSLDIWNASVDADADKGIPVNATIKATISSKGDDVITEYNTFTANPNSVKKKIFLNLTKAGTAATFKAGANGAAFISGKDKLDFSTFELDAEAVYKTGATSTPITKYGSLLSLDIAAPTSSLTAGGSDKLFTSDASKVTAAVGSFAVTGVANANADWKADDLQVDITFDVRASEARNFATPTIATAPTFTTGTDLSIVVPNVGEATVEGIGAHNDEKDAYGDYIWETSAYTVTYAENATTNETDATIKISKDDAGLAYLADEFGGEAQDFLILLSDGRLVVTSLTAN